MTRRGHRPSAQDGRSRPAVSVPPSPAEPDAQDRSWAARATALRREKPANLAMIAAVVAVLAAFLAWVTVLVPEPGSARGSPVFWLLALPLMAWTGPLLGFQAWAVRSVPLALAAAPVAALAALWAAQTRRAADVLAVDGMDTPLAMLVILGVSLVFALAGLVALRRSSLPGGTRPAAFAVPGSMPPGLYPLPVAALQALRVGSLALTGVLVNGMFFGIVALLDLGAEDIGPLWPVILPLGLAGSTLVLVIRGIRGLVRRRAGAGDTLRRGLQVGAGSAVLLLPLVWIWPTDTTLKLAFSGFMLPVAAAAAWGARRAIRDLRDVGMMQGS